MYIIHKYKDITYGAVLTMQSTVFPSEQEFHIYQPSGV